MFALILELQQSSIVLNSIFCNETINHLVHKVSENNKPNLKDELELVQFNYIVVEYKYRASKMQLASNQEFRELALFR